jgi:hypothetical protein
VVAKKWVASVLVLGPFSALLWTSAAQALEGSVSPNFRRGTLVMLLTDHEGRPQAKPILQVTQGYPGMPAVAADLTVRNAGSEPATYALSVEGLPTPRGTLADVLVAYIRDDTGSVVYQGGLRGMAFQIDEPLEAGSRATYSIEIKWPAGSDDGNEYQGQQVFLDMRLTSEAARSSSS